MSEPHDTRAAAEAVTRDDVERALVTFAERNASDGGWGQRTALRRVLEQFVQRRRINAPALETDVSRAQRRYAAAFVDRAAPESRLRRVLVGFLSDRGANAPSSEAAHPAQAPAPQAAPSEAWQDAASAPRTGEHILVTRLAERGFGQCGGKAQDWCAVVHYWDVAGEEGFYLSSGASSEIDDRPVSFTHWMPLPGGAA